MFETQQNCGKTLDSIWQILMIYPQVKLSYFFLYKALKNSAKKHSFSFAFLRPDDHHPELSMSTSLQLRQKHHLRILFRENVIAPFASPLATILTRAVASLCANSYMREK